ncbi:MAG: hypothetical protein AAGA56_03320 [Myxococcota bacterium]
MMKRWSIPFAVGLLFCSVAACSSDEEEPEDENTDTQSDAFCSSIIAACHDKDQGQDAEVSRCHDMAHDNEGSDEAACEAERDHCVKVCNDAEAGGHHGHDDHGEGGKDGDDDHDDHGHSHD